MLDAISCPVIPSLEPSQDPGVSGASDGLEGESRSDGWPGHLERKWQFVSSRAIDDSLLEVLEDLFGSNRDLFPTKFETTQDLQKSYQVFRTLRRTSDTQALEMKVNKDDINVVNRWTGVEKSQGRRPGREMRHYYADIMLLLKPFQRYTQAM
jgi:hypothetical protein